MFTYHLLRRPTKQSGEINRGLHRYEHGQIILIGDSPLGVVLSHVPPDVLHILTRGISAR